VALPYQEVVEQSRAVVGERERSGMCQDLAHLLGSLAGRGVVPWRVALRLRWGAGGEQMREEGAGCRGEHAFAQPCGLVFREPEAVLHHTREALRSRWDGGVPVACSANAELLHRGIAGRRSGDELVGCDIDGQDAVTGQPGPGDGRRQGLDCGAGNPAYEPSLLASIPQRLHQPAFPVLRPPQERRPRVAEAFPFKEDPRYEKEISGASLDHRRAWKEQVAEDVADQSDAELVTALPLEEEGEGFPRLALLLRGGVEPRHDGNQSTLPGQ